MTSKGKKTPVIVGAATFGDAQMEFHAAVEEQIIPSVLLRLSFAQHSTNHAYYASLVAAGPIVAITASQRKNWRTSGHPDENLIITEKVEDVETILVTHRVKLPLTTALDKKTYETTTKNLIQAAHTLLIKTLYNACDNQDGFKTFTTTPVYITHKIEFDIIVKDILYEYQEHHFSIMFEVFFDLYKRRQLGASIQVPSLNTLSDTNNLTIDEFANRRTSSSSCRH
jgi:hypothetical protein